MIDAFDALIGRAYTPVITAVYDATGLYVGDTVATGAAGVDWSYIACCVLAIVSVYCLFRLVGQVIDNA